MQSIFYTNTQLESLFTTTIKHQIFLRILAFIAILVFPFCLQAQKNLSIDGTLTEGSGKLAGGEVKIKEGSSTINTVTTAANGKFTFELPLNSVYMIEFTKSGYVTKRIEVDTRNVPEQDLDKANFHYGGWKVELFEDAFDLDASILNQPIGKVTYNSSYLQFANDHKYTKSIQRQLDQLLADLEAARKEEERRKRQLEEDYELAIEDGDAFFKEGDFENALFQYQAALQFKPDEAYPTKMIAKAQEEMGNAAELEEQYAALLTQADDLFAEEKFAEAIPVYQQAIGIKPKEKYPKEQIEIAQKEQQRLAEEKIKKEQYDAAIAEADKLYAAENWVAAKDKYKAALVILKDEEYPKQQIADIDSKLSAADELEKQYASILKDAEDLLKKEQYEEAKTKFEEAQTIKPQEARPPAALQEIETALAAIAAAKAAEEAAEKERLAKLEADYNAAIQSGDQAFEAKDFSSAIASYETAASLKEEETYPTDQIAKAKAEMENLAAADKAYQEHMTAGNSAKSKEEFEAALASYNSALGVKSGDEAATAAIAEVNGLIQAKADAEAAAAAELQAQYDGFVKQGDDAYAAKDLSGAIGFYEQALGVKPEETYPTDQIAKAKAEMENLAAADKAYQEHMTAGNSAKSKEEFEAALASYNSALGVKSGDEAATAAIAEVNGLIQAKADAEAAAAAELQAQYDGFVKQGDDAYAAKDLSGAIGFYEQAQGIKPEELYPQEQITKLNAELAAMADAEEAYALHMKEGAKAQKDADYESALASYNSALGVKSGDAAATAAIAEINGLIQAKADAEAAAAAELQAQYDGFVKQGDDAYAAKDLSGAIGFYEQAQGIKPEESYPQEQITKLNAELAAMANAEEAYALHMSAGNDAKSKEEFEAALASYNSALGVKSGDAAATAAIAEVNGLIQAKADAEAAAAAELQAQYDGFVKQGDDAYAAKDLSGAIGFYEQAQGIKPEESYPQEQIAKLNAELASMANAAEAYALHMKEGAKAQKDENYEAALTSYNSALGAKPEDAAATAAIAEVNGLIQAKADAEAAAAAELQAQYDGFVKQGDDAYAAKDLSGAIGFYEQAQGIKPEESYPQEQIAKLNAELASMANAAEAYALHMKEGAKAQKDENYEAALASYNSALGVKSGDEAATAAIAEVNGLIQAKAAADAAAEAELQAQYDGFIKQGDDAYTAKDLNGAISFYEQAQGVKPEESYPQEQITKIRGELTDIANTEEAYANYMSAGKSAQSSENYENARESYQRALEVKPNDAAATASLNEVNGIIEAIAAELAAKKAEEERIRAENQKLYDETIAIADAAFEEGAYQKAIGKYRAASKLLPEEVYPATKVAEIEALMLKRAQDAERYQLTVQKADALFQQSEWDKAKLAYSEAQSIMPEESYPNQQIEKIDAQLEKLAVIAAAEEAKRIEEERKLEEAYSTAIQEADDQFQAEQYKTAIIRYESAQKLKPEESYPQQQIDLCNQRLGEIAEAEAARLKAEAEEKALRERYQMLVDNGDVLFTQKRYNESRTKYEEASAIYPEESYPKEQIQRIADELAAIEAAEEAARIAEEKRIQVDNDYKQAIIEGNQAFDNDELDAARVAFQRAADLKPNETVPPAKLDLIDAREAELARIAEQKRLEEERLRQKEENYQNFMTLGLDAFGENNFEKAKSEYQKASDLFPDRPEPKEKIKEISRLIDEQKRIAAEKAKNDTEFNYELAKKYPQGRTENVTEKGNKVVTQIIIVEGNRGDEYVKERYSWGQEFYLKNQKPYNKNNWLRETRK